MELKPIAEFKSCCSGPKVGIVDKKTDTSKNFSVSEITVFSIALTVWWLIYQNLPLFARYVTYSLLGPQEGSHLSAAVEFFIYDTPKVLMLLTVVVFGVGIVNTFFTAERTRSILAGKRSLPATCLRPFWGWRLLSAPARRSRFL